MYNIMNILGGIIIVFSIIFIFSLLIYGIVTEIERIKEEKEARARFIAYFEKLNKQLDDEYENYKNRYSRKEEKDK